MDQNRLYKKCVIIYKVRYKKRNIKNIQLIEYFRNILKNIKNADFIRINPPPQIITLSTV